MQVKLWPKSEKALKARVEENPLYSVVTLVNFAVVKFLETPKPKEFVVRGCWRTTTKEKVKK